MNSYLKLKNNLLTLFSALLGAVIIISSAHASELKLTASDAVPGDTFGLWLSVNDDVAIVGAPVGCPGGYCSVGMTPGPGSKAYVFRFDGQTWIEEAILNPSDETTRFGFSVDIDGDLAVVGATLDNELGNGAGAAYVYRRIGSTWVQEAKLLAADGAPGHQFGIPARIDGDTILVGAHQDDANGARSGSAYIFRFENDQWVQEAKLLPDDSASRQTFGNAGDIEGNLVVVGALRDDEMGANSGAAYLFRRNGSVWTQDVKLVATVPENGANFGRSVALSDDTLVIGAQWDDEGGEDAGAAYIFRHDGTRWFEEAKLIASDTAQDSWFGFAVGVSGDVAVVGAHRKDDEQTESGAVYVYRFILGEWVEEHKLIPANISDGDNFGWSVGVSGSWVMGGTPLDDDIGMAAGAVVAFDLEEPVDGMEIDCEDIRRFTASCGTNRVIRGVVQLEDSTHDDETIVFAIDELETEVTINGNRATLNRRSTTGSHVISLLDPAQCLADITVNCP
ncbi:MAG: hypothetical protein ACI808_000349 [Paraglaciecola sp.]|jgi:hypothetical protein